jgi:hypothetical protein
LIRSLLSTRSGFGIPRGAAITSFKTASTWKDRNDITASNDLQVDTHVGVASSGGMRIAKP